MPRCLLRQALPCGTDKAAQNTRVGLRGVRDAKAGGGGEEDGEEERGEGGRKRRGRDIG